MTTYLDIGVARVQTYLARSAKLRSRTRASGIVSEVSRRYSARGSHSPAEFGVGAGWEFNGELGKVDGVISLRHPADLDDEAVRHVAVKVLTHLRAEWPGAEMHAGWGRGRTYSDAYRDHLGPMLATNTGLVSLPPPNEVPLARPCDLCEQEPAVEKHTVVGEVEWLCTDCQRRGVHDGTTNAQTFERLAAHGDERGRNHLATVFVDGNAVGSLFIALAGADAQVRGAVSEALPAATRMALDSARNGRNLIEHVCGGDDLLASLPACQGWGFTRDFLREFRAALAATMAPALGLPAEAPPADVDTALFERYRASARLPTAAAGLVIAHTKHPFSLCVEAAEERLRAAKEEVRGADFAVAWTDMTIDGGDLPTWRRVWTLDELERHSAMLDDLRELPRSALKAAIGLVDLSAPVTSWARLHAHLRRFEEEDLRRRTLGGPLNVSSPRELKESLAKLLDLADLSRWW